MAVVASNATTEGLSKEKSTVANHPEGEPSSLGISQNGPWRDDEASNNQRNELLSISFNQDFGCFAVGTDTGFRVFNCDPLQEMFRRDFSNGGIGAAEMLFRCNILALVGGGQNPRYPPNKVMIWDDQQSKCIGEMCFRNEVRAVRLRRDRICVALDHKIYVYNFADLKLLHQIETAANPRGLCCLSPATNNTVLACPGLQKGQVRVELYDKKSSKFVSAHDSTLACISLTSDGEFLATASSRGTLVRVFSTEDGSKLHELRRGADRAEIYSIAFSPLADWLAVSSDKGTVHVFGLKGGKGEHQESDNMEVVANAKVNTKHGGEVPLGFLKAVLPKYFNSQWSFAQFRLPFECHSLVAFGPQKHSVIIVGYDGSYYKCLFDPLSGGEMIREEHVKFLKNLSPPDYVQG